MLAIEVIAVVCAYVGLLFLVARFSERRRASGSGWTNSPVVYALALGVYCTTWTFYGSIGKATIDGMLFLPVYLGPTIGMFFAPAILDRLIRLKERHHITSLADFISARYAKSRLVAALVTVMLLFGTIPYAALQFKSLGDTFEVLTEGTNTLYGVHWVMPLTAALMIAFTIMFGIRRLDPTERHPGMVVSLAAESLTKLLAFLIAGAFIIYWAFGGPLGFVERLSQGLPAPLGFMQKMSGEQLHTWLTYMLLSIAAFSFLPRQFHVGVIENSNVKHTRTAMWLTPLYLLCINLFVVPIAIAGMIHLPSGSAMDTALLKLPLSAGQPWIALLVFVGGFSAATGMIMVETMTMATMMSNHLFLPALDMNPRLWFLRRHLLPARWVFAALFISAAFGFWLGIGKSYMLVSIGMISFAAVLQLAPASLGGLFWRHGSRTGALLGLGAGFVTWTYTLLLPTFVKSGWMSDSLLAGGPFGWRMLRPTALFGLEGLPSLSHGVLWTVIFNVGFYVLGSVVFPAAESERRLAENFVTPARDEALDDTGYATLDAAQQRTNAERVLTRYFSRDDARNIVERSVEAAGLSGKATLTAVEWAELNDQVERSLAGAIGSASAHAAMHHGDVVDETASKALAREYAKMLARMRISPAELRKRIDYYQEREALLKQQAAELEQRVRQRTHELTVANDALRTEVVEREKAQAEVLDMSERLADAARRAGKAEVATNVLHNVGNVLNSVLVSVRVTVEQVKASRVVNVGRVAELLQTHSSDLGRFFRDDPRGQRLPAYLRNLSEHLRAERLDLLTELESVGKKADHIKHIVAVQQEFAGVSGFLQATNVSSLIEDAIRINTLEKSGTEIVREFAQLPRLSIDKHKVLQILINLLSNAKHAVKHEDTGREKRISVRLDRPRTDRIVIAVTDTGMGIAPEDRERLFQHGFTTRKDGHGFGLHAAIMAAQEMGGSLTAESAGRGRGATFTLEIPCSEAVEEAAQRAASRQTTVGAM
jgi:Na+/proline symporter/C4-dicarboxylate-specific signal transduction histidine kinase